MRKLTADYIFTNNEAPIHQGVVIEENGKILDILHSREGVSDLETFEGFITPGFVNAHCHLELSHLKGVSDSGKRLVPFLLDVVSKRDMDDKIIMDSIAKADQEMREEGIVLVGDISNGSDTAKIKEQSSILYHTFFELFDMMRETPDIDASLATKISDFEMMPSPKSFVPHAPYSVSTQLYEKINNLNPEGVVISIHNQETLEEDKFFIEGKGDFRKLFETFGAELPANIPVGYSSAQYWSKFFKEEQALCIVHNTFSSAEDIKFIQEKFPHAYWVTCPNANLYIENALPNYQLFDFERMAIGTDSLTSNWQLSILDEMKVILKLNAYLNFEDVLKWATINGARALKQDGFGSLELGNSPGINLIKNVDVEKVAIKKGSVVEPLN
ncbi:MAG: amidohydrolase family protein [Flavobacteriales bacterium]|nr:amidohydrolase family protein [Flavobacteriales bacterium]